MAGERESLLIYGLPREARAVWGPAWLAVKVVDIFVCET